MRQLVFLGSTVSRRSYVQFAALAIAGVAAACSSPAASPTAAPAKPTAAPAKPAATTAPAKPTVAPAKPAATTAPAKPTAATKAPVTFKPATARSLTTSGATQGVGRAMLVKRGFYKEFGLDVTWEQITDGNRLLAAAVAGETDLADGGIGGVFPAVLAGADLKILGSYNTLTPFVVYASSSITSLKQLEGKSVGTGAPGALLHSLMTATLRKHGVDPAKVSFVNIGGSPAVFQAVAGGKVDAGPSQISYTLAAKEQGLNVIADLGAELPDYVNTGLYASEKTIKERREILVRMLAAYAKMFAFVKTPESRQAWIDTGVAEFKLKPEDAATDWEWMRKNNAIAWDLAFTEKQSNFLQQVNIDDGNQSKKIAFNEIVDLSLAKDALKLAGITNP